MDHIQSTKTSQRIENLILQKEKALENLHMATNIMAQQAGVIQMEANLVGQLSREIERYIHNPGHDGGSGPGTSSPRKRSHLHRQEGQVAVHSNWQHRAPERQGYSTGQRDMPGGGEWGGQQQGQGQGQQPSGVGPNSLMFSGYQPFAVAPVGPNSDANIAQTLTNNRNYSDTGDQNQQPYWNPSSYPK